MATSACGVGFRLQALGIDLTFAAGRGEAARPPHVTVAQPTRDPERLERIEAVDPTAEELAELAGRYPSDELGISYSLHVEDGALALRRLKADPDPLQPTLRDVFVGNVGTLRFTRHPDGSPSGFLLTDGRVRNLRFTRP